MPNLENTGQVAAHRPARVIWIPNETRRAIREPMTIEEKIREIMISKELSNSEKLDGLHALIPWESFEIDDLSKATPAQVRLLRDGLAVTDAMEKIRCADFLAKEDTPKKPIAGNNN
jgi:hypothetical protein